MITNPASSAVNLITSAQHKAADAAQTIATLSVKNEEVGSADYQSTDLLSPILSLNEAELETSAAVKILQADEETKGALFDAMA